jgi:Rod binding domain-containing protein
MSKGPYASTMQDTLSAALVGGQGLGLARQLYKEMQSS